MSSPAAKPEFGELAVKNVVSTHTTQVGKTGQSVNLPAVALVCSGKYGRGVFPADHSLPFSQADSMANLSTPTAFHGHSGHCQAVAK